MQALRSLSTLIVCISALSFSHVSAGENGGPEWASCQDIYSFNLECPDVCSYFKNGQWENVGSEALSPWAGSDEGCSNYEVCQKTEESADWDGNAELFCKAFDIERRYVVCTECNNQYREVMQSNSGTSYSGYCSGKSEIITGCEKKVATIAPTPAPTVAPTLVYTFAPTQQGLTCEESGCWTGDEKCCSELLSNLFVTSKMTGRILFLDSGGNLTSSSEMYGDQGVLKTFHEDNLNIADPRKRLKSSEEGGEGGKELTLKLPYIFGIACSTRSSQVSDLLFHRTAKSCTFRRLLCNSLSRQTGTLWRTSR
jgi:hypothetical protein